MYEMLWYIEVFLELGSGSARKAEGEDQRFPPADFVVRCYLPKLASQAATCRQCSAKDAIPSIPMLGITTRTPLTERNFITGHRTGVDKVALSKPGGVPPERESANKRCNSFPPSPIPSHHLPPSSHHFINVPGGSSFLTPSTQHPSLQSSPQQANSTEPLNASRWLKREKRERQRRPVAQSPLNLRPI
jgi:hypothetical protein